MAYRTGFWGLDGPLEGPIPIRRASSFNAGAPKADHLCVGAAENGKRDVGGLGWARPCLAFCHNCHIYDVMRSTKKLEGLLNLIRAGAGEDGIYALAAAARSPRSEGSTRGGGSRSEQNGRYRTFFRTADCACLRWRLYLASCGRYAGLLGLRPG